jgi:NTE family protein
VSGIDRLSLGALIDIFRVNQYFQVINAARDAAARVRSDAEFVGAVRRAAVRLPFERRPAAHSPFPARRHPALEALEERRVGIVATGGSGALASLLGVLRAFEECRVEPSVLSFSSGAALFALPVAAGVPADEVAEFVLGTDPVDWCDVDWRGLAGVAPRAGRGWAGVMRGEAVEASFRHLLGDLRMGDLATPAYFPAWNVEHNRLEYVGPRTHPELTVARAVRMAISIPLLLDPVRWAGGNWCDGGIVDIFPVRPALDIEPAPEAVVAVNCFYPHEFEGEQLTGWRQRSWSIVEVASQVRSAQHVQLARENLRRLRAEVPVVELIEPVAYSEVRGAGFYAEFLERDDWPRYMLAGRRTALAALGRVAGRLDARPNAASRALSGARS